MNIIKKLLRLWIIPLVVMGLVVPNLSVFAQEQQSPSPYGNRDKRESYDVYSPPAVFATDLLYNQKQGRGYFTILNNSDDVVSDIIYRIEVLGELPKATAEKPMVEDTANLFYRKTIDTQIYSLKSKEKKFVEFQYTTPNLPSGKYRLRIQITGPKGGDLGWKDANFEIVAKDTSFLSAVTGAIIVPEYGEKLIPPMSGPNVAANSEIKFNATVENKNTSRLSAVSVLRFFKLDGTLVNEIVGSETVFDGRKEVFVQTPVTTPADPGAYYAQLYWRDLSSQQISPLLEYRIVVKGESARIKSLRVKSYKLENNSLPVVGEVFGPADAETIIKGKIAFEIKDDQGLVGSFVVPEELTLDDSLTSGIAMVPIQRSTRGQVVLQATLKGLDGKVLDTHEIKIEPLRFTEKTLESTTKNDNSPVSYGILSAIIIVVLLVIVAVLVFFSRKYKINWKYFGLFILILLPVVASGVYAAGTNMGIEVVAPRGLQTSDWGSMQGKPAVELFINEPVHNSTFNPSSVPLSFRAQWAVCENGTWDSIADIHYLIQGGKISTWRPPAGKNYTSYAYYAWAENNCPSGSRCFTSRNVVVPAGMNLNQLNPGVIDTTLRVMLRGLNNSGVWIEREDYYAHASTMDVHAVNLWLNLLSLQCTASNPTPVLNEPVTFNVTGGNGTYSWTNPDGTPNTGAGASFSSSFSSIGTKVVDVQDSAGTNGRCTVNVDYAPLACAVAPNPTNVSSDTSFTVTGGNTTHPIFRFIEGTAPNTTLLQESTSNIFTKSFESAGTKTINAERCDISVPVPPPAACTTITKTVSGTGDSTVSITAPCDGTLNVKTADDRVLTTITKIENGQTQHVAICDDEGVKDWCGDDTGGGQCCTVPNGGEVVNYQSLLCNRDGSFLAKVPKGSNYACPTNSTNYPIQVRAGDIITMRQTKSGSKSSITFTPPTLPVPSCEAISCPPVTVEDGPQIEVSYIGNGGNRIITTPGSTVSVTPISARTFSVKNNGSELLTVSGIAASTTSGPGSFSATRTTGFTVPPNGGTEIFTVSLGSSASETRGTLSISNNSPTNPYELNLVSVSGEGENPGPVVSLTIKESTQPNKESIAISRGQDVTLVWNVEEVASCTARSDKPSSWLTTPGKDVTVGDHEETINSINSTTTFSLDCAGNNGTNAVRSVSVTVSDPTTGTNIRDL